MERERHPRGLIALFTTEMWERFGFYLMVGILFLYLTDKERGGMGWSGKEAAALVGSYMALVYFTPFIGGLIADRLLGCRKTIVIGAVLMMAGYFCLAFPGTVMLYVSLGLIILGNGAFKPNISTILGNLYPPGSKLRDAGYNIFYMGINIGAFVCNFVAALVRNHFDRQPLRITSGWTLIGWHAAFATAGVGMLLGLIIFLANYRSLAKADPDPSTRTGPRESLRPLWLECLLPAAIVGALAWCFNDQGFVAWLSEKLGKDQPLYKPPLNPVTAAFFAACIPVVFFYVVIWRRVPTREDRGRVGALLTVFGVVIVFWSVFGLNTTALTEWTRDNTDRVPGPVVRKITDPLEGFTEEATPAYFKNAGPETPVPEPGEKLKLINPEVYQSINPFYVVIFTPLVVGFWHFLRLRGWEPSTAGKIGIGLLLTALGPLVMLWATAATHNGEVKGSAAWLFGTYAMATLGELCLSPMGLSLVNKTSPANLRAFMMGGWFLSTSIGMKLSGFFGELYQTMDHYIFWPALAGSAAFFACVIFALLPWLNRQMTEQTA